MTAVTASGPRFAYADSVTAPLPREHGAWGILLQPFFVAALLAGAWHWQLVPAALAVLLVFACREPLLILARQRWTWRTFHPETDTARRFVVVELALLSVAALALLTRVAFPLLALMGLAAVGMTALAIYMTLHNRQRSAALQIASALALSASALLPAALTGDVPLPAWVWPVWILHAFHAATGIFVVHARIDRMQAARRNEATPPAGAARAAVSFSILAGLLLLTAGHPYYAIPLLFSAAYHARELRSLAQPATLQEPFKTVGLRNLTLSIAFSLLLVVLLWPVL